MLLCSQVSLLFERLGKHWRISPLPFHLLPGFLRTIHLPLGIRADHQKWGSIGIVSGICSGGEHETPLDGGSQRPPYSMWYHGGMILLAWVPVEDWEVVDGSLNAIEKALQVVSSHSPNKATWTATGPVGWISLTALKVNMDSTLCDSMPVATCRDSWKN